MIQNPILPGFHPDPSIIRVGEDYYLATSTFEWFPGIPLYHSRDLKHWTLMDHLLKTKRQADLTGLASSHGVWAPGLSYDAAEKRIYLIYSIVHGRNRWMFDVNNYMMRADDIRGPWSDPVYINSSGFDPYIFHDDDGSKWILNKERDFRPWMMDRRPIVIQRFDAETGRLAGEPAVISTGATRRRFVEGPHLFKKDGWYYLLTAEGGTGYGHCAAIARSRSVTGPYESCPRGPVLTSAAGDFAGTEQLPYLQAERYAPDAPLQKAGHASFVSTPQGEWYMVHLCGRPVLSCEKQPHCILGRETAIQAVAWDEEGWPRLRGGGVMPALEVEEPSGAPGSDAPEAPKHLRFDGPVLDPRLCTPRNVIDPAWASLTQKRGWLSLLGRETLTSQYEVSLLARRLTSLDSQWTAKMRFEPARYHHMAGLTCYYDARNHYCAFKTYDETQHSAVVAVYAFIRNEMKEMRYVAPVPMDQPLYLRAAIRHDALQFSYSLDGKAFMALGDPLDMTRLSDEGPDGGGFTGSFVGLFAQDIHTKERWAHFETFDEDPE